MHIILYVHDVVESVVLNSRLLNRIESVETGYETDLQSLCMPTKSKLIVVLKVDL